MGQTEVYEFRVKSVLRKNEIEGKLSLGLMLFHKS